MDKRTFRFGVSKHPITEVRYAELAVPPDGETTIFILPCIPLHCEVYKNGMVLQNGRDYTVNGSELEFVVAPKSNDAIHVRYGRAKILLPIWAIDFYYRSSRLGISDDRIRELVGEMEKSGIGNQATTVQEV